MPHAYMHTCIHAHMHTCTHAHMHTYMRTCIHVCMHTCMHACMHACIHALWWSGNGIRSHVLHNGQNGFTMHIYIYIYIYVTFKHLTSLLMICSDALPENEAAAAPEPPTALLFNLDMLICYNLWNLNIGTHYVCVLGIAYIVMFTFTYVVNMSGEW